MTADVLIIGQGLAGSVLGWTLERAGVAFAIADAGHEGAATVAAAGIINPITGRRLVTSWRVDALLPLARTTYQEIGDALGLPLWRALRVRRLFADERERAVWDKKRTTGELAPFAREGDEAGFWIEGAARVDLRALIAGLRTRWEKEGRLRRERVDGIREAERGAVVIDCSGLEGARGGAFEFVPWEFSKGEMLELAVREGALEPDVVLNRRHWLLPVGPGAAWVGATHEPGVVDRAPTLVGRAVLEASARQLLSDAAFTVTGHRAGVRVNLPDKRPVAGRHPLHERLGLINGLGAKGALWAPMLAAAWARHLREGAGFDAEIDVARFAK